MDNTEIKGIDFECTTCKKIENSNKRIPVSRILEKVDTCYKSNDLQEAVRILEYWQKEAVVINDTHGELSITNELLGVYRKNSNEEKAKLAINRARELLFLTNMNQCISGGTIMVNIATACNAFGLLDQAYDFYTMATSVYSSKNLSENDYLYAALYNNFATTLTDLKIYDKAKELYQKAIKITNENAKTLLDSAISYVNLAHLFELSEGVESDNIEVCLSKAEEIFKNENIIKDSYYAFVCEKCASSFEYFGYYFFSKELKEMARKIYERA